MSCYFAHASFGFDFCTAKFLLPLHGQQIPFFVSSCKMVDFSIFLENELNWFLLLHIQPKTIFWRKFWDLARREHLFKQGVIATAYTVFRNSQAIIKEEGDGC